MESPLQLCQSDPADSSSFPIAVIKVDQSTLFDIILAANYLDIKLLLDIGCKTIADLIKGKTPQEIRELYVFFR